MTLHLNTKANDASSRALANTSLDAYCPPSRADANPSLGVPAQIHDPILNAILGPNDSVHARLLRLRTIGKVKVPIYFKGSEAHNLHKKTQHTLQGPGLRNHVRDKGDRDTRLCA